MIKLIDILFEGRYKFIGTCDRVRAKCQQNEDNWHTMMSQKKKISNNKFFKLSDLSNFLDEDETPKSWVYEQEKQDSSAAAYESMWGKTPCTFYQVAGFEYIFVK